ncbi:19730_t:CDS:2 [Cetraspora pellucida]|uniref:19730_t:CDS:1 n=1 Tax=Cetraspora pellucida TaxID=1433469 RepID=A0A9N9HAP7_9GLOM|nr:19730_t:CDS:2 [Cetraspora pellucida]
MNSIQQVEELIKEYLLAEKIIEELYSFIANSDINGLLDYWEYLNIRYFSRLDARYFGSVKKFKISLLRYYLVYATQQKRKEKVLEFFDTFETDLNGNSEWSKWFDRFQRRALESEVQSLHNVIVDLKSKIEHYDTELANLRQTPIHSHELLSPQRCAKSLLDQKNNDA